ncbi:MAG TPA: M1 family aminopeptidase [Pyrinomonadaceae bacterium]|nr:M1 family aminopeptidase [Pyrinomonadaceae bacterium]
MSYLISSFILLLFVLTNISSAQQPEKKQLPPANLPRERMIDVKNIALNLQFDWAKKQAFGTATITFSPLNATDKIALDAGMLTINSIKVGEKSLKFDYDGSDKNDNLKITLDRNYQSNEEVTVKIDYRTNWINEIDPNSLGGNNGKGLRFNEPNSNDPIKLKEIWSFGDPESNRYWFPSFDSPSDLQTTEFTGTVDKKLTVIANGNLIETKDNTDGTRTFRWKMDTPYANHLTSFVVGEFVNVKKNYEGITLNNFGSLREKDWIDASTERLPDMVKFFSEKTGVKFPYPNYSQVFVQDIGSFTSNMNVSTITENMVDDFPTHADYFYLWDLTEAEALAGQWFGGYVSARDWSDVWLNKSFAHYFNRLYCEQKNGKAEWLLWFGNFDQGAYFGDWNAGIRHPIVTKNYENTEIFVNDNYSTIRGAMVLKMLHQQLGEENWWKAIRHYLKSNANRSVKTADFQKAVEESTGEKLDWFFDQWLYKIGHPIFEVTKNYEATKKQLTLNVKQTQTTDKTAVYPQVEFFQGKIEIEIDGRIEQVWLKPQAENIFTFTSPTEPKLINFDYENTWIRELKFEKSFDELLYQFQNSKDVLARSSAMKELVQIAKNEKTSADDKTKISAALRNMVLSNAYWRLRNSAMSQMVGLFGQNKLDETTISTLLTVIKNDKSWLKSSAIGWLGNTQDKQYTDIYLNALNDESFRVINSAAIALGKTKDAKAFDALAKLKDKPSMKSQSLLCALAGLKALEDPRGFDIAYKVLSDINLPRWRLSSIPPSWDYRDMAADTIKSLGKSDKAYPLIFERFKKSMAENDINGIFTNVFLIITLADSRGQEAFDLLKQKFKDDGNAMNAVNQYETQFKDAIKK